MKKIRLLLVMVAVLLPVATAFAEPLRCDIPRQRVPCDCPDGSMGARFCGPTGYWSECNCSASEPVQPAAFSRPRGCVPGRQLGCACPDGKSGVQTCSDAGRFGACECSSPTSEREPSPKESPMRAEEPASLQKFRGSVQLSVTAALVAPRKDSGLTWDPGSAPALPQEMWQPLSKNIVKRIVRTLIDNAAGVITAQILTKVLPWAIEAFAQGAVAPDVIVTLYVDGNPMLVTQKVNNTYFPTWSARTRPLVLTEQSVIDVSAVDFDLLTQHDHIGRCTSEIGIPSVDSFGYMSADTFRCYGQLWAVAVRVLPAAQEN